MPNTVDSKDFWELWQEIYQELCVLKCQVSGLSQDHLPEELQFGLFIQVERLFNLHNQFFEAAKGAAEDFDKQNLC